MSLLPSSRPEVEGKQQGDFRVLGFDDETTDTVLEALSSETARSILHQLHDEPRAPSELAELEGLSIQNVSYHLDNLETADLVTVVGTQYSEKGREMNVYGPADEPLVVFVGTNERKQGLKSLLKRFIGATGLLAVLSILLHTVIEGDPPFIGSPTAGGGPDIIEPALPIATDVFLGGITMLVALLALRRWQLEIDDLLARIGNTPLLIGRNRTLSRRVTIGIIGGSAVLAVLWLILYTLDIPVPSIGPLHPAVWFSLVLVGAAFFQAYSNDGLLVSWLVVFGPVTAIGLGFIGLGSPVNAVGRLPGIIGYPIILGSVGALVLGTTGFLIGAVARRLVTRIAGPSSES
jgi:DNA-binding transcriptional ArsR family regulator